MYSKPAEISAERFSFLKPISAAANVEEAISDEDHIKEGDQLSEYDTDSADSADGESVLPRVEISNESSSREDPDKTSLPVRELNFLALQ